MKIRGTIFSPSNLFFSTSASFAFVFSYGFATTLNSTYTRGVRLYIISASFARVNNYGIAYNHNSGNTYGVITHTLILNSFAYG